MNKLDKKNLEEKFAEDFATKYFPMLSNIYFLEGDLKRARKVCEIGLQYNPNNTDGLFILSKIELLENNNIEAEKNLKKIIKKSPGHINALQSLIKVSEQLKRSENTIHNYIKHLIQFFPKNDKLQSWLKKYNDVINKTIIPQNINLNKKEKENIIHTSSMESNYKIEKSMITFTMVNILRSQKHYNYALAVLDELELQKRDSNKIEQHRNEINKILSSIN
tara:strand:- start:206 stop:868 length:663 start_codon:yes stop_codon:yes gene_type:complete